METKEERVQAYTLGQAFTHWPSSDLGGHLLSSGSLAASSRLDSEVLPRQLHRIILLYLIPPRNWVWHDWPVPPGALGEQLRHSLLTLCGSYGCECMGRKGRGTLKERLVQFGMRQCQLCRRTPTVCVPECSLMPVWVLNGKLWGEECTLSRYSYGV